MRRTRVAAALGATALIAFATPAVVGVVDRVLPHEVQPWDMTMCTATEPGEHALIGVTPQVPERRSPSVTVLEVQPVGLAPGTSWRSWVVPVAPGGPPALSAHASDPPAGWADRVAPGSAQASAAHPVQLFVELWSTDGRRSMRLTNVLVRYRTEAGFVRHVVEPTSVTMRAGGCG